MDWITAEEARDLAKSSRVINNIIDDIMKRIETIASDGQYMASVAFPRTQANCIYEKIEEILVREWGYKVGIGFLRKIVLSFKLIGMRIKGECIVSNGCNEYI